MQTIAPFFVVLAFCLSASLPFAQDGSFRLLQHGIRNASWIVSLDQSPRYSSAAMRQCLLKDA